MRPNETIPDVQEWDLGTNDVLIAKVFYELEDAKPDVFVDLMWKFFGEVGKKAMDGPINRHKSQGSKRAKSRARTSGI